MKHVNFILPLFVFAFVIISCGKKSGESEASSDLPSAPASVADAKTKLSGKKWSVVDVALRPYQFENEKNTVVSYEWFSAAKSLSEFEKKEQDKFLQTTFDLSSDSVANTTGIGLVGPQKYILTDTPEDDKMEGVRLEISGKSDDKDFQDMEVTYTYYVLGANEKRTLLQTPNSMNNRPIVLLLEIK